MKASERKCMHAFDQCQGRCVVACKYEIALVEEIVRKGLSDLKRQPLELPRQWWASTSAYRMP